MSKFLVEFKRKSMINKHKYLTIGLMAALVIGFSVDFVFAGEDEILSNNMVVMDCSENSVDNEVDDSADDEIDVSDDYEVDDSGDEEQSETSEFLENEMADQSLSPDDNVDLISKSVDADPRAQSMVGAPKRQLMRFALTARSNPAYAWRMEGGSWVYYSGKGERYSNPLDYLTDVRAYGVDVSEHQGWINWAKVANSYIDFAIVRVADANFMNKRADKYFDTNMENAAKNGVPTGVYIYSRALTVDQARKEADFCLEHVKKYDVKLPIVIDVEETMSDAKYVGRTRCQQDLSRSELTEIINAFSTRISNAGYTPMLYTSRSWYENEINSSQLNDDCLVWMAAWGLDSGSKNVNHDVWQCSSIGKVEGINGYIDLNFGYAPFLLDHARTKYTDNLVEGTVDYNIWVRPYKGANSSLGILKKGERVVGKEDGNWLEVVYGSEKAYIAKDLVTYSNYKKPSDNRRSYTGYTDSRVLLRPQKNSSKYIKEIPSGTKVSGKVDGDWLEASYQGVTGFVRIDSLRSSKPEPNPETVVETMHGCTHCDLWVRPSKGSSKNIGIISEGTKVNGTVSGAWLKITFNGSEGYIAKYFVDFDNDESSVNPKPNPDAGKLTGTLDCDLWVRPSVGSKSNLGIIGEGTYVEGTIDGAWLKFQFEGKTAYIARAFVTPGPKPVNRKVTAYTSCNVYVRPNPNSTRSLGIMGEGVRIDAVDEGAWLRFNFKGSTAYIAKNCAYVNTIPNGAKLSGKLTSSIWVRPSMNSSSKAGILFEGTNVEGIVRGNWLEIDYLFRKAYIARAFVK